jgi:hypothetical protein
MLDNSGASKFTWTAGNQLLTETGPFASDTLTNSYLNRLGTALSLGEPAPGPTDLVTISARRLTSVVSPAGAFNYAYTNVGPGPSPGLLVSKLTIPNGAYITNFYDSVARVLTGRNRGRISTIDI